MIYKKTLFLGLVFLMSLGCTSSNKKLNHENLLFGHRGSGANVYDHRLIENTLPSIEFGLEHLDGCEVDIQLSKDGTIWIYHDDLLGHFCDSSEIPASCIPLSSDDFLKTIKQCRDGLEDRLYTLDEVLAVLSRPQFQNKFLSLDAKGYFDSICFPHRNASLEYQVTLATELVNLVNKYSVHDRIIVETNYLDLLKAVKSQNPAIRCHLLGYSDFNKCVEKALDNELDGVSFSLFDDSMTPETVQEAKLKGLEVQVWPINDSLMLDKALNMRPFALQISKITFATE